MTCTKKIICLFLLSWPIVLFGTPRSSEPISPIEFTPPKNPEKVELGKMLFFEPRLSKSGTISCNSCHNIMSSGTDNLKSSIGHGWQLGPINSPTVFNSKYNLAQFWDGRAKDLKEQAGGPIANPGEMAFSHELAIDVLNSIPEYKKRFQNVYGTSKAIQTVNIDRVTDAIAAFEETLVTPNSPFDKWLKGDDKALSSQARKGYALFKNKGCISCHNGPAVGGNSYQRFGLVHPYIKDKNTMGRYNVTKKESDRYVFKVPTLRNVALTYPYFHDGSVWNLEEAVETMAWHQLGTKLKPEETKSIVAFLNSLTGERPKIQIPLLPSSTAATPRPKTNL